MQSGPCQPAVHYACRVFWIHLESLYSLFDWPLRLLSSLICVCDLCKLVEGKSYAYVLVHIGYMLLWHAVPLKSHLH